MADQSSTLVQRIRDLASPHAGLALADVAGGAVVLDAQALAGLRGAELEASEARALREDLVRWIRGKNQFAAIDEEVEQEIEAALVRLAHEVGQASLADAQDALDDALDGLASVIRQSVGESAREVVVSEYAPDLQLAVLGLPLSDIASPVLDVGCGASAGLVRHLRGLGREAFGIDRDAPSDALRADWITYDYGTAKWKTVLSHLGFSLHFLRAHHASDADARTYAETYLRILKSLTVGGVFAYAPSLPFFESVLPKERFRIERSSVPGGATLAALREKSGVDLAEATRVRRMG